MVYEVGYGVSGLGTGKGEQGTGPDQARSRHSQEWVSGDNLETSIPFPFPPSAFPRSGGVNLSGDSPIKKGVQMMAPYGDRPA